MEMRNHHFVTLQGDAKPSLRDTPERRETYTFCDSPGKCETIIS